MSSLSDLLKKSTPISPSAVDAIVLLPMFAQSVAVEKKKNDKKKPAIRNEICQPQCVCKSPIKAISDKDLFRLRSAAESNVSRQIQCLGV